GVDDAYGRADLQTAVRRRRNRRVERVLDVDDAVGLRDVVLQPREQVLAAGEREDLPAFGPERGNRVLLGRRVDVGKGFHSVPPAFCASMAARIFAGVSGRLRIVTPVALRTALAIAADVDPVGGSPIPMTPRDR